MNIEIENFIPNYPSISDENFQSKIYYKKEFNELKLSSTPEPRPTEQGQLLKHQMLIQRFLSSHTLYDEMIINFFMGGGKTCAAIGTVENIFRETNVFKRAVVITVNDDLIKNFKMQILNTCTPKEMYGLPDDYEIDDTIPETERLQQIQKQRMKLLRGKYEFHTFYTFYQSIRNINPEKLIQQYSNCIFIIDEVHHLTSSKWYNVYHKLLHIIENRKILLMSGTLMRNYVFELGIILNLILPLNEQLNIEQDRIAGKDIEFYNTKDGDEMENMFISTYIDTGVLKDKLNGRISYIGQTSNIPVFYKGTRDIFPNLTIYEDEMNSFQYNVLASIQDRGYKIKSQQASLFVFPNGDYGSKAWEHYETNKREWRQIFSGKSVASKLDTISIYSSKYASTIRSIIDNPTQNTFVFNTSIRGGGAKTFGMCLEQFGFSLITNSNQIQGKSKRYTILSSEFIKDKNELLKIVRIFNNEDNKNGDYLSVLIGGRKVSEGISFRNIENIHILSPHWNFSLIDQAIARGIRVFSHTKPNSKVNVFLHASVKRNEIGELQNKLIDVDIYSRAVEKNNRIQNVQNIVKEASFDCALTFEKNYNENDVVYRCNVKPTGTIDYTTYDMYYANDYIKDILKIIFRKYFFITTQDLYLNINKYTDISFFQMCKCLIDLMNEFVVFKDKYDKDCYLKYDGNIIFLTDNRFATNELYEVEYTSNPILKTNMTFEEILNNVHFKLQLDRICALQDSNEKYRLLSELPSYVKKAFRRILNN